MIINKDIILNQVYPIGSIYMSVNSTNPGTLFGGTWTAWGTGRVPVGIDTSQTEFNTVEKTGGSKEMQRHGHEVTWGAFDGRSISISASGSGQQTLNIPNWEWTYNNTSGMSKGGNVVAAYSGSGNSGNLQPYITCYMWKRTA